MNFRADAYLRAIDNSTETNKGKYVAVSENATQSSPLQDDGPKTNLLNEKANVELVWMSINLLH